MHSNSTLSAEQEDAADLAAAHAVLALGETPITWEQAKVELGLTEPLTAEHDEIGGTLHAEPTLAHPLAGLDDDLEQDLAVIGVELTPGAETAMEDARRQAYAAVLFRRVRSLQQQIAETASARDLEIEMVHAHYERQLAGPRKAVLAFLSFIETLALLTTWGKKRSCATLHGTFGVRKKAPTVELSDDAQALAWAREVHPELVRVTVSLSLVEAREVFTDADLAKHKMSLEWGKLKATLTPDEALPPGVVAVDGGDEPFAKPAED